MRVLFVVKRREDYCQHGYHDMQGGLFNSARFVVEMLNANGVTASLVQVVDNNDIDREVTKFKPDTVVIEALWVVPSKFKELIPLHPKVKWVVRIHSEIPFLALEGMAIEWISGYMHYPNITVAANSERAAQDIRDIVRIKFGDLKANTRVAYLPNWYPSHARRPRLDDPYHLNIGCFGAIRPFKNQLIQAVAAIKFAEQRNEVLRFHINATRCEQQGDNVLKNMRALFANTGDELVEHDWEDHGHFIEIMREMDVSMNVSLSETFNIIAADAVTCSVPVVASKEISWISPACYADPTNVQSIVEVLDKVTSTPFKWWTIKANLRRLRKFDRESASTWLRFLK